jgi:Predicted transcriptional regulators
MKSGNKFPSLKERLPELRAKKNLTQKKTASLLGCDYKSYRNWEVYGESISVENLIMLADFFNVSTDYLLGRTEFTSVGNKEINEAVGLSDKSIEVLRHLNSVPKSFTNDIASRNQENIEMLNYFIEDCYDELEQKREKDFPIQSMLSVLHEYIYCDLIEVPLKAKDFFVSFDTGSGSYLLDKPRLFRDFTFHQTINLLEHYREKVCLEHGKEYKRI